MEIYQKNPADCFSVKAEEEISQMRPSYEELGSVLPWHPCCPVLDSCENQNT